MSLLVFSLFFVGPTKEVAFRLCFSLLVGGFLIDLCR